MTESIPYSAGQTRSATGRGREGAILGLVLVVMVVLSFVAVGLMTLTSATGMEAGRSVGSVQAFWTAEAGLEQVKTIAFKRNKPFSLIVQAGSPSGYLYGSNALVGTTSKGSYAVDVLPDPAWTNAIQALKKYVIVSRATARNGTKQRVSIKASILNFAYFMHASDVEGSLVFASDAVIDGPVYTNDRLNIDGTPRFLQMVWSAVSSVHYQNGGNSSVFEGGLTLNAPKLNFTNIDHIAEIKNVASSGGLSLTGDYRFKFKDDGSFTYVRTNAGSSTNTAYLSALNGAIYVNGDAWVEGVVNGEVTLAAQDAVFLTNNVTYASAQSPNPWQTNFNANAVDDTLGLMASNQVQIVGTNEITIHAAVMVTRGADGFNAQKYNVAFGRPPINLYGSLSQEERGTVGQPSAGKGFSKNYKFDTRFNSKAPPNYPYGTYAFSQWTQDGY
jgi:hypothetical protein